ncbi:MAG: flagellar basal body rod protein FlgB [Deltaproteobacteria bacterium]|jgi:flagellar basal-body rod protein FlgB|nr:flagellar basal body rod protein FlgB [Deltaproteobacteria bacterium]
MPTQTLFEGAISLLQKSLNRASLRHKVITSNIANIDTPNYKAFEVVMEDVRQKKGGFSGTLQLVRTEPQHLNGRRQASDQVKIKASQPVPFNLRADGNTVDLDRTMGKLAENTIMYRIAAQLIRRKFQGLKNIIKGGQ